jgi:hypothetical protein
LIFCWPAGWWVTFRPNLCGCRNDLSQVLLSRLHISFHQAIWLRVKGVVRACSQALRNLWHEPRLEVPALVTVQLSRDPEAAEVGH